MEGFINNLVSWCTSFGLRLIGAILLLIVGWILTKKLVSFLRDSKKLGHMDRTTASFVANAVGALFKVLLVVVVISLMGVPMASVVAVLATAGAAIGLALQGGLSNIAGGILITIFKPFKIGDFIVSDGESGTVTDINLFYTTLLTPDNKTVHLPNGAVSGSKVTDLSSQPSRRLDFEFTVAYGTNTNGVIALLKNIGENHPTVLHDQPVSAMIGGYNERGIVIYFRVWCKGTDYWDLMFDLNKIVKEEFERYEVKFALPQLDVHMSDSEKD